MTNGRLVLVRHGESTWNFEQRFTGWADVPLTATGIVQMINAGRAIAAAGIDIDLACSSVLVRCIHSQRELLEVMKCPWVPQSLDWRLNERHYGALTGLLKFEAEASFGVEAVRVWRRSYEAKPPPIDNKAKTFISIDRRYAHLPPGCLPVGESLAQTVSRVFDFWIERLIPAITRGQTVLVTAHGNSLRGLIKSIEKLSDLEIARLEVANGAPIVYGFDSALRVTYKDCLEAPSGTRSAIL